MDIRVSERQELVSRSRTFHTHNPFLLSYSQGQRESSLIKLETVKLHGANIFKDIAHTVRVQSSVRALPDETLKWTGQRWGA